MRWRGWGTRGCSCRLVSIGFRPLPAASGSGRAATMRRRRASRVPSWTKRATEVTASSRVTPREAAATSMPATHGRPEFRWRSAAAMAMGRRPAGANRTPRAGRRLARGRIPRRCAESAARDGRREWDGDPVVLTPGVELGDPRGGGLPRSVGQASRERGETGGQVLTEGASGHAVGAGGSGAAHALAGGPFQRAFAGDLSHHRVRGRARSWPAAHRSGSQPDLAAVARRNAVATAARVWAATWRGPCRAAAWSSSRSCSSCAIS